MKRRIYYLLLLMESCCLMALYRFQGLRFLFCCIVLIPLVCFLLLIPMVFLCTVSLEAERQTVTRTEPIKLKLAVENKGRLPVSGLLVCVRWKAPGEKEVKVKRRLCGVGHNTREEISFELSASHCGQAQFRVSGVRLFDYLGIFSLPVKRKNKSVEVRIHPVVTPISREAMYLNPWELGKERDGDMLLRDYLEGDSLRRVYWQLFLKNGELQIRDFEKGGSIRIFLDFSAGYRERCGEWDSYLDMAVSLLYFLVEDSGGEMFSVEVAWRRQGSLFIYDISDVENLQVWLGALLTDDSFGEPLMEEKNIMEEAFCLKEDCRLYFGEQCVYG